MLPEAVKIWEADIDFSGAQTANDIIEVINLLNGTGAYAPGYYNTAHPDGPRACVPRCVSDLTVGTSTRGACGQRDPARNHLPLPEPPAASAAGGCVSGTVGLWVRVCGHERIAYRWSPATPPALCAKPSRPRLPSDLIPLDDDLQRLVNGGYVTCRIVQRFAKELDALGPPGA